MEWLWNGKQTAGTRKSRSEYTYRDVSFPVTFAKSTWTYAGIAGSYYQSNMKEVATHFVKKGEFDTCVFIWDVDANGGGFFTNTDYYDAELDLLFISVASKKEWEGNDDIYRVVTHEIRHAFYAKLRHLGINLADTMDTYR